MVSLFLVLINVLTGGTMWAQWPIMGWGIGILGHAYGAFVATPKRLAKWEAQALAQAKTKKV